MSDTLVCGKCGKVLDSVSDVYIVDFNASEITIHSVCCDSSFTYESPT